MLTASIAASSNGDNTIVSAVAGFSIRVISYVLSFSTGTVNAKWMSGTGGGATALTGLIYGPLAAGASQTVVAPANDGNARGWFQTDGGKALNLNLSAGVAVGGHVVYELVSAT